VRRLGPQGTLVATKRTAFLLLCIGVQIMLTGTTDALRPLLAGRS
jgi:multiple antibiotic resistance protein